MKPNKNKSKTFSKRVFSFDFQYVLFCNVKRIVLSSETAHLRLQFDTFHNLLTFSRLSRSIVNMRDQQIINNNGYK